MEGAEAEHAARRRLITRVLRDLHACLEVSAKAAGCAEQHISPMLMLHRKAQYHCWRGLDALQHRWLAWPSVILMYNPFCQRP